jgi:hypothetical protein
MALDVEGPTRKKREPRFVPPREAGAPGFGPSMPTCGNDLIGLWELPEQAVTQAKLKVGRAMPMSTKLELLHECTVQEYSLESVARKHGPGEYQIILNPGPMGAWGMKKATINVSQKYADENGFAVFQAPPMLPAAPRFSELRSIQETTQAMQAGQAMTPAVMVQLMETMVERVAERLKPPPPVDPMAGMGTMVQMMTFMNTIQNGAMETALKLAGLKNPVAEPDDEDSWPGVIREALPALSQLAQGFMSRLPAPQGQAQPQPQVIEPEGEPMAVPLSQDEMNQFAPMVAMLKPHAALIVKLVSIKAPEQAAAELATFIPGPLRGLMVHYADLCKQRGKDALALIDPALVSDKGWYTVVEIGKILREV